MPRTLHISHRGSGGTSEVISTIANNCQIAQTFLLQFGRDSFEIAVWMGASWRKVTFGTLSRPSKEKLPLGANASNALLAALDLLAPDIIYVHNSINWPTELHSYVRDFDGPVGAHVHDFYWVCPQHNLIDSNAKFCFGDCSGGSGDCSGRFEFDAIPTAVTSRVFVPVTWRPTQQSTLKSFTHVFLTSHFSYKVISEVYPGLTNLVLAEPMKYAPYPDRLASLFEKVATKKELRIASIGNLNFAKGIDLVAELARLVPKSVKLYHYGALSEVVSGVIDRGPYQREALELILEADGIDCVVLASNWGETYSVVLDDLFPTGLPVFGLGGKGAVAERLGESFFAISPDALVKKMFIDKPPEVSNRVQNTEQPLLESLRQIINFCDYGKIGSEPSRSVG